MVKFNLPKPAIFRPTKSLHSTGALGGGGGGDVTNNYFYAAGISYAFSNSTNPAAGATPGFFCFNSATVGSITKCYVAKLGNDSQNWTATLALMTSGVLNVYEGTGGLTTFSVTRMVEQADWFEFDVAHKGGALPASQGCYVDFTPDAPGVRELIIGLVQTSTNDPVVTVIKNSYQQEATPSRIDVGKYKIPIPGAFTANKTVCDRLLYHDITNDILVLAQVDGTDEINITTFASGVLADDILGLDGPTPLRIRTTI